VLETQAGDGANDRTGDARIELVALPVAQCADAAVDDGERGGEERHGDEPARRGARHRFGNGALMFARNGGAVDRLALRAHHSDVVAEARRTLAHATPIAFRHARGKANDGANEHHVTHVMQIGLVGNFHR
jgi:hypothetical protein